VPDKDNPELLKTKMPEVHGPERKKTFVEVELGFTPEDAVKEAKRCLRCDVQI
jgi:hypothetical protein